MRGAAVAPAAAAMPKPARPKAGPTKDNTTAAKEQLLCGGGFAALANAPFGGGEPPQP